MSPWMRPTNTIYGAKSRPDFFLAKILKLWRDRVPPADRRRQAVIHSEGLAQSKVSRQFKRSIDTTKAFTPSRDATPETGQSA